MNKNHVWVVEGKYEREDDFFPLHLIGNNGNPLSRPEARSIARDEREWGAVADVRVVKYVRAGK